MQIKLISLHAHTAQLSMYIIASIIAWVASHCNPLHLSCVFSAFLCFGGCFMVNNIPLFRVIPPFVPASLCALLCTQPCHGQVPVQRQPISNLLVYSSDKVLETQRALNQSNPGKGESMQVVIW